MKTYGIAGLGVMGASFAARLKELGYPVIGMDVNPETLAYALEHQIIDEGYEDFALALPKCDVVIFCIYPTLLKNWLETWQSCMKPGTLLMEISGVKRAVIEPVRRVLRPDVELISIHPMCGRESRGITYSTPAIFEKANFIIVPVDENSAQAIVDVSSMAKDLGCQNITILDPVAHDEMIAFLSQLTHVIAVSLMNTHENAHLVEYTGDSFRDLTRIAKINEEMWSELFVLNKDLLLSEMDQFESSFRRFRKALEEEDRSTMEALMIQSTERRKKFDR